MAHIGLPKPASRGEPGARIQPPTVDLKRIAPSSAPPKGCVVDAVPEDARIDPVSWGPLKLLGVRMDSNAIDKRRTIWVETWWTTDVRMTDIWMYQRVKSRPHVPNQMWWADHEHCDWAWPTSRWKPGQVIRDVYGIRPPHSAQPGPYELFVGVIKDNERVGSTAPVATFQYR